MNEITPLNEVTLAEAVERLCKIDTHLKAVVDRYGTPPLWARKPGFPTLVHIILEQQVSLASAKACFDKLNLAVPDLSPGSFLILND